MYYMYQSIKTTLLLLYLEHKHATRFDTAASHSGRRLNKLLRKEWAMISHKIITYIICVYNI